MFNFQEKTGMTQSAFGVAVGAGISAFIVPFIPESWNFDMVSAANAGVFVAGVVAIVLRKLHKKVVSR